jgi:predicted ATPase
MLRTWQISNFKSIRAMSKPLEFAPLTVFCGSNSSGKSSLLQSVLLFKQTLQKEIAIPRMALNGGLVQLGRFSDIASNEAGGKISCAFQIEDYRYKKAKEGGNNPGIAPDKEPEMATECRVCIGGASEEREKVLNRYPLVSAIGITDMLAKEILLDCSYIHKGDLEFPVQGDFLLKGEAVFDKSLSPESRDNTPAGNVNDIVTDSQKEFYTRMKGKTAYYIFESFDHLFPRVTFDNSELAGKYRAATENIYRFFCDKLYYIGPLRADPKENGDTTSQNKGVGYRGEYSAECFAIYAHQWKEYPYIFGFEAFENNTTEDRIKIILRDLAGGNFNNHINFDILRTSFIEWLTYLEVADNVGIDRNGELGVRQGKHNWKRLNNVGVGVSQVLPIILQCILAEPGSVIIIEQPELHLHPKTQSRLADFFLVMSLLGKQIIIETHSEYIIDKLRLRIVQAPGDTLVDKVAIYFAEKKDGNSEFRRIRVNEYSAMSEWPEGFFEESVQIARDIMSAVHKKREENGGDDDD